MIPLVIAGVALYYWYSTQAQQTAVSAAAVPPAPVLADPTPADNTAVLPPAPPTAVALVGLAPAPTPAAPIGARPVAPNMRDRLIPQEQGFWTIDAGDESPITLKDPVTVAAASFNPGGLFGGDFGGGGGIGKGGAGGGGRGVNPN